MRIVALITLGLLASGCGSTGTSVKAPKRVEVPLEPPVAQEPESLLERIKEAPPLLITNVTLLTARDDKPRIENGWIRLARGQIVGLGDGAPPSAEGDRVVDGEGRIVTPGLIDTHSHLGVYPTPHVWAHGDGNEMTNPITAGVRAEEAFWPQDPGVQRAVAGGVTTIQVLPGSGNLMGGRAVVLKLHPRRDSRSMRFPGAKDGLKMACGENPKRVYGKGRRSMPMSRMGSLFMMRKTWVRARRYKQDWDRWRANPTKLEKGKIVKVTPPKRDLVLETLAQVLAGEILVHVHCYRADEMLLQLKLADEFGFKIRSFHHAVEAYKIRDVLARKNVSVSTWADWWGFKIEAYDAIEENLALLAESRARAILHTDSAEGIQRMNQEMSKAYWAGRHAGIKLSEHEALKWITANPAWALGIQEQTGTLTQGKMADLVLWEGDPFSVYAQAELVIIDGHIRYNRAAPGEVWSDFEVGQ